MNGLSERQRKFADAYLKSGNATAAYKAAGYKANNDNVAASSASALLRNPKVSGYIAGRQAAVARKVDISVEKVAREMARLGFSDMTDYLAWGPDGLRLKASAELTEDQRRAVASIEEHITPQKDGPPRRTLRFKLHDKRAALEDLGRHLGMFKDSARGIDQDVLLKAFVMVLLKFVPQNRLEDACIELGKVVDSGAYEMLTPRGAPA